MSYRKKLLKRMRALLFGSIFVVIGCLYSTATGDAISAKAYTLVDQQSGRLLAGQNQDMKLPMASTTKIMTGLLAVESGKLDKTFTVPPQALQVEGSSMGLQPDEQLTLRELVYGLMLESGNDAANAIAIILGGAADKFVARMNEKAKQLGLKNTHFCNPSGLNADGHYTTALDLARLAAYAMRNPDFAAVVGTKTEKVPYNGAKNGRTLVNHNRLLDFYDGAIGVKTGFTKKCGRCLVSCARRNGVTLIAVTLNDPDDWDDHKALLDWGYSKLSAVPVFGLNPPSYRAAVTGGVVSDVPLAYDITLTAALAQGESARLRMHVELSKTYRAPVREGQVMGKIYFSLDNVVVAQTELKAVKSVAEKPPVIKLSIFSIIWSSICSFFHKLF